MKNIIAKYSVVTFYIVCLFTAVLLGLVNMVLLPSSADYMLLLPQWAPALAAILVTVVLYGKSNVRMLFENASFQETSVKWSFVAVIFPIIVCGLSYVILSFVVYKQLENPEFSRPIWNYGLCLLAALFGSYGEEIGWRGFMLPQLNKKYSLFISTLIVGICWGFWHLKFQSGIQVFALYILLVIEFSLVISWLWSKTKGNIVTAILFHTSVNICSLLFFEKIIVNPTDRHTQFLLYEIYTTVFAIPCVLIAINFLRISKIKINKMA